VPLIFGMVQPAAAPPSFVCEASDGEQYIVQAVPRRTLAPFGRSTYRVRLGKSFTLSTEDRQVGINRDWTQIVVE
jgi:hypothetical protein